MQKITVISVGRLKDGFFKAAEQEYLKRLSAYCEISTVEINQENLPQNPSEGQITAALKREGEEIISKIPKSSKIITLCIEGKQLTSEGLAEVIKENADFGSGLLTFIIGGSFGLSDEVKGKSGLKLSMSKMTFPHRMAKIMLLEQIYRGFTINSGTPYHK